MGLISNILNRIRSRQQLRLKSADDENNDKFINEANPKIEKIEQIEQDEETLFFDLSNSQMMQERFQIIDKFMEEHYKDKNGIKILTVKEQYKILKRIVEENSTDEIMLNRMTSIVNETFKTMYRSKILESQNPHEVLNTYNEYVHDFLKDNSELEEQFREELIGYGDIERNLLIRKIDCLRAIPDIGFRSMDDVPLFYDTLKENHIEEKNAEIARTKLEEGEKITAKDLAFIRLTPVFPTDGVVEHIGEYSGPETLNSPFEEALLERDPNIDLKKFNILIPRFRWTSHWCINGAVGDHLYGTFSGRDYIIIEEAEQRKDDPNIIGDCVADTMMLGDTKLSKNARIAMPIEKYKELLNNPKTRQQLKNFNIVLFNDSQEDCVKLFLNDTDRVWGIMSSYSYAKSYFPRNGLIDMMNNEEICSMYLESIENSLKNGEVEGLSHCHYASEGFLLSEINPSNETLKRKMIETKEATRKIIGATNPYIMDEINLQQCSYSIDTFYTVNSLLQYIKFLDKKFPDMHISEKLSNITEEYWSGDFEKQYKYKEALEGVLDGFEDVNDLLSVTDEYNALVLQQSRIARENKNKELLEQGLITKEQYDARKNEELIEERN